MRLDSGATSVHRVFIVDDHPLFRLGLRSLLDADGSFMVCGEAEDAKSALAELRRAPADLVIVDITLRGANGIELLKLLKAEMPDLRALLMSMHDEDLYAERTLRAGAAGYIKKDSPPERVLAAIKRALRGGLVLSDGSAESLLRRLTQGSAGRQEPPLISLSDRELEIFQLMGQGASTRECADRLHISVKTVEAHQSSIKGKLHLKGANQLRRYAVLWANQVRDPEDPSGGEPAP